MKTVFVFPLIFALFLIKCATSFPVQNIDNNKWITILKPAKSSVDFNHKSPFTNAYLVKNR